MEIIRSKGFVRAWPAEMQSEKCKAAIVGIMEIEGNVVDERIHSFTMMKAGDDFILNSTGNIIDPCEKYGETNNPIHSTDFILTGNDWERPEIKTGIDGGGVFFRKVPVPAERGQTYHFISLVSTNELQDQSFVEITGNLDEGMFLSYHSCARQLQTNGKTLSQIMGMPIWGWQEEPWGLITTVNEEVAKEMQLLGDIRDGKPEEYEGQRDRLEKGYAGEMLAKTSDPLFAKFKKIMSERYGPFKYYGYMTASENEQLKKRSREIIAELLSD
jgi:hypothetical protein